MIRSITTAPALYDPSSLPLDEIKRSLQASTVCIRESGMYLKPVCSIMDYEERMHADPVAAASTQMQFDKMYLPGIAHGTGVVIGTEVVDGNLEYLILTNRHVGHASPFKRNILKDDDGDFTYTDFTVVDKAHTIVENRADEREDATPLELIAVSRDTDSALMRTKGADVALHVLPFPVARISVSTGTPVITSGYPSGVHKIVAEGSIILDQAKDFQLTPVINTHYLAMIPIDEGQSGSATLGLRKVETSEGPKISVELVGLVYGKASGTDTVRMITPTHQFLHIIDGNTLPSERPSLFARVDEETFASMLRASRSNTQYTLSANRNFRVERRKHAWVLRESKAKGDLILDAHHTDWAFRIDEDIEPTKITYCSPEESRNLRVGEFPALQHRVQRYLRAHLNHLHLLAEARNLSENAHLSDEVNRYQYLASVLNENILVLAEEGRILASELYDLGVIPKRFLL